MAVEYEVRLLGAPEAKGEIRFTSLAALAGALQDVVGRIGRDVEGRDGAGRSPKVYEELTQLTLIGVRASSTALQIRRGLDIDLGLDLEVDRSIDARLVAVLGSLSSSTRPDWMSDVLAEGADRLAAALRQAAPDVAVSVPGHDQVLLHTADIDTRAWGRSSSRTAIEAVLAGRLIAVDVESRRFALRDDVGNRLALTITEDVEDAAGLVGERVWARGSAVRDARGTFLWLTGVRLERAPQRAGWSLPPQADLADVLASAPGPDPEGGVELTDEEYDAFMRALDA